MAHYFVLQYGLVWHQRLSAAAATALPFGVYRPHPHICGLQPRADKLIRVAIV